MSDLTLTATSPAHQPVAVGLTQQATFVDAALNTDASVRALVSAQQTTFQKSRGSHALALMVATAYIAIRKILANATAETQAAIFDEHGVPAASNETSVYTPWIKVQWGEHDLNGATFKDSTGTKRALWVPDRSMEIYHHTMEALAERGVETQDAKAVAKIIMASKGALVMAKERQRSLSKDRREAASAISKQKCAVFLEETMRETVSINIDLPDDMGEYATILVRHIADTIDFEVLGVVDKNANSALAKLAKEQFSDLMQRKTLREQAERNEREIKRRLAEQKEQLLGGMTPDARKAMMLRVSKTAKAAFAETRAVTKQSAA